MVQKLKFCLACLENIVEKVENAGYQHFLLFQFRAHYGKLQSNMSGVMILFFTLFV